MIDYTTTVDRILTVGWRTTATQLVWLTGLKVPLPQQACNQKDTSFKKDKKK